MTVNFINELPSRQPSGGGAPAKYMDFAEALRGNPGKWAEFPKQGTPRENSVAGIHIRKGNLAAFRCGGFEAANRNSVLYVRYVGKGN